MRFRRLIADDDAVSPVIGVILMVAMTVILAATIGAFVMDFDGPDPSPQAQWEVTEETNSGDVEVVEFKHASGEAVTSDELQVIVDGDRHSAPDGQVLRTQDAVRIEFANNASTAVSEGTEITLVWSNDRDHVLAEHTLTSDTVGEDVDSVSIS